jgi:ABC-type dipeptide/oligopeptide/nickel transport system permease subunit
MDTLDRPDPAITPERIVGTGSLEQVEIFELEEDERSQLARQAQQDQKTSISPLRAALRRFLRDKRAVLCLGVLLFLIVGSFVFPPIYQHLGPQIHDSLTGKLIGPEKYHQPQQVEIVFNDHPGEFFPLGANSLRYPLGTDYDGRDLLARIMAGLNISIELAILVEVFDILIGMTLGTLAGWYGGWLGLMIDRFTDIVFAFPGLLLVILIGASLGPIFDLLFHGAVFGRLLLLTLALGILAWPLMMRFVRGRTLELKEQQFIEAARTAGGTDRAIILRHIVPNLMNIVVVAATLDVLNTIIGEAGISLLGAGLQPPAASLGIMISDGIGRIYQSWTELFWPCLVLVIIVICFSFVGDGVRDAFDPRTKD